MKIKNYGFIVIMLLFISCSQKVTTPEEISPSGINYKITSGGNFIEKKIQKGQFVKLNLEYRLKSNDSVISSTYKSTPIYLQVDKKNLLEKYSFLEILLECKKNDKLSFSFRIDSLAKYNRIELTKSFKTTDLLIGKVEILDIFDNSNQVEADFRNDIVKMNKRALGTPIKLGVLLIAQYDFPKPMKFEDAKMTCANLGDGWRLPTSSELQSLYSMRGFIGNFKADKYISSIYEHPWGVLTVSFQNGNGNFYHEGIYNEFYVRAVKDVK